MGKMKRYNVISLRITDQERESLERVMLATSTNVTAVMREALRLITGNDANRRGAIPDQTNLHKENGYT
jgi:hypothetical protein